MTTHVAIGANDVRDYQFLVPLSAVLWKERIGFHPIVMTCGDWETKRGQVVREAFRELGLDSLHLKPLVNFASHTLAQNCREYASALDLPDEDWIMPSDADLWPIMRTFYQQHLNNSARGTLYYANGDHYSTFPTCHITLKARDWRALGYGPVGGDITDLVEAFVSKWLETDAKHWPWKDRNFAIWMSDQAGITDRLRQSPWMEELKAVERQGHPPTTRIDRGGWRAMRPDDIDAHIQRAPDEPGIWPNVLELFSQLLPERREWVVEYHRKYWEAYR